MVRRRKPPQPLELSAYPPAARPEIARLRAAEEAAESISLSQAEHGAGLRKNFEPDLMSEFAQNRAKVDAWLSELSVRRRERNTPPCKDLEGVGG